jgi:hypothetical protein
MPTRRRFIYITVTVSLLLNLRLDLISIRGVGECIDVGWFILFYDIFTLYYYIHVINLSYYPKRHSYRVKLANRHVSDLVDYKNGVGYHYME